MHVDARWRQSNILETLRPATGAPMRCLEGPACARLIPGGQHAGNMRSNTYHRLPMLTVYRNPVK